MSPVLTSAEVWEKESVDGSREQMRWADWGADGAPVLLSSVWRKHPLFQRDPKELPGEFLSFYLSHAEMRRYHSPTAGHPKIKAGNVRLQSVRWGQERWAHIFQSSTTSSSSSSSSSSSLSLQTPQAVRQDEDRWPTKTPWHLKQHPAMYTCWTASRSTFLSHMMMNRPPDRDIAPTQWLPQNSSWLMRALQATRTAQTGTQHPPDAAWTGGTSTLAPNTKIRICSCHQASSYFDVKSTLPYKTQHLHLVRTELWRQFYIFLTV